MQPEYVYEILRRNGELLCYTPCYRTAVRMCGTDRHYYRVVRV